MQNNERSESNAITIYFVSLIDSKNRGELCSDNLSTSKLYKVKFVRL